jgi:hypothetical protein
VADNGVVGAGGRDIFIDKGKGILPAKVEGSTGLALVLIGLHHVYTALSPLERFFSKGLIFFLMCVNFNT